ncbi:MAG: hypothetical protein KGZ97_05275 [Bacteroidetes bacterium]|nr:hypothetical protein [Bacteroidota bacterium]
MKNIFVLTTAILFSGISLLGQGIFESLTTSDEKNEEKPSINLGGYVRGSAYGGSEYYDYSNLFGEFALQGSLKKGKTFFYGEVRFIDGLFYNERESFVDLTEAYAGYQSDRFSAYIGNQIVSWGRTDGFNPTNNITPVDYFFLTSDNDDQLLSNFLLRTKINLTPSIELDLIAIPFFKESVYRYDLFSISEQAAFVDAKPIDKTFKNSSIAARLNFELPAAGFSLSYFRGYDPFYGIKINSIQLFPSVRINYIPDFYLKNTIGGDFAIPIKQTILRGEAALNITENYKNQMHIPNPDVSYVFGIERNIFGYIAIVQYVGKFTLDYKELTTPILTDPNNQAELMQYAYDMINYESEMVNRRIFNQQEQTNHAIMLIINKSFAYDLLDARMTGYSNFTTEEYLIRPEISYKLTDELSLSAGSHLMFGPEESMFNYSGKVLNGGFISLKASF